MRWRKARADPGRPSAFILGTRYPAVRGTALRLLVVLALLPTAAGQDGADVDLLDVALPELVVADVPFEVELRVANRLDEAATPQVYAVLYDGEGGPCGSQASPRWRGLVSRSPGVAQVPLAPGETRTYPDPARGEGVAPRNAWLWRVDPAWTPEAGAYEVCVFAARDAGDVVHLDVLETRLNVRPTNEPPAADFAWTPAAANATTPMTFTAMGADADGDPVTFRWDLGHLTAAGRATAEGPSVTHRFWPAGFYDVTLVASDGFATTTVTKRVEVLPEEVPTPTPPERNDAGALGVVAVGVALGLAARRR